MTTKKTKAAKPVPAVSSHERMYTKSDIKEHIGALAVEHIENGVEVPSQTTLKFSKGLIKRGSKAIYRVLIESYVHTPTYTPHRKYDKSFEAVSLTYADLKYLLVTLTAAEKFVAEFKSAHKAAFEKAVSAIEAKLNELKVGDVRTIAKYRGQIDVLTKRYNSYVNDRECVSDYSSDRGASQLEIDAQKALNALETI